MEYLVVSLMFIVFLQTRFVELRRATLCLALQSALIAAGLPRRRHEPWQRPACLAARCADDCR